MRWSVFPLIALLGTAPAVAQIIAPPPRSAPSRARTTDPNRTTNVLTLNVDFLSGHDDNVSPEGATGNLNGPRQSSFTSVFGSNIRYLRTRGRSSQEMTARAFMNQFRNIGIRPLIGGDVSLRATQPVAQRATLMSRFQSEYSPMLAFRTLEVPATPDGTDGIAADAFNPTSGLTQQKTLNRSAVLVLSQDWSSRNRSTLSATYTHRVYEHSFTLRSAMVDARHSWEFIRRFSVRADYRRTSQVIEQVSGEERPLDSDMVTLGLEYRKDFSRTRSMVISGGPSANSIKTVRAIDNTPLAYVTPSGYLSFRMDIVRSWSLSTDFRRQNSFVEGLTRQSFITDAVSTSLGGDLFGGLALSLTGQYSVGAPNRGEVGSYKSGNGTLQFRYGIGSCCSVVASQSYYFYRLQDLSSVTEGIPSRFERNAVRVGMTMLLPLHGTPSPAPSLAPGRN